MTNGKQPAVEKKQRKRKLPKSNKVLSEFQKTKEQTTTVIRKSKLNPKKRRWENNTVD